MPLQGHCLQRFSPPPEDYHLLGPMAEKLATQMCGNDPVAGKAYLKKICAEREPTLAKKSFDRGRLHLVSVSYLRWLTSVRQFHSWELVHFIGYESRLFSRDYMVGLLAERQRLKLLGPGEAAACNVLKLVGEGIAEH